MSRAVSFFVSGLLLGVLLAGFGFVAYVNQSAGLSAGEGQTVLKLGHSLDTGHPVHVAMEFMGDRLAELSGRAVRLDIYPSGVLGSEVQCIEQLQVWDGTGWSSVASVENNYQRRRIHRFDSLKTSKIRILVTATNGDASARLYEVRAYNE